MPDTSVTRRRTISGPVLVFLSIVGLGLVFAAYAANVGNNPPGYYVDESVVSYNAYLVSRTGAGESGVAFPLFFPAYHAPFTQYANPTQVYLLAAVFKVFGPGIVTARLTSATCVFIACLLLGWLAFRISGRVSIGVIVGAAALATPWLFEVGRVILETFFYPLATVLLLLSVHRASRKDKWSLPDMAAVVASLTLVTYSYTVGRLLGPLLAGGLILFATGRARVYSILRIWAAYALALVPLAVYIQQNPAITTRFRVLSYIRPTSTAGEVAARFVSRFFEDIDPTAMLIGGDINARHHLPGVHGSFLAGIFVIAVVGIIVILAKHRRSSWWLYILFGLLASVVPGALTTDAFHTLRMVAYPVFLLTLTVPALCWFFRVDDPSSSSPAAEKPLIDRVPTALRQGLLTAILTAAALQAGHFFWLYHMEGANRGEHFDAGYKTVYDAAVARPERPIHLVDGYWGPAYVHALWYATIEGRDTGEFVHVPYRTRPPAGSLVLSSEFECSNCEILASEDGYHLYVAGE